MTSRKKNIYIIRHGETDFNKMNIVQGSGVDTDLNEKGRAQAASFFKMYGDFPFGHVYTSALKRSQQSVHGFIEKGLPHTSLPGLNEICWGDFEGKQQTEEQRKIYWEIIQRWNKGDLDARIPNGESPIEMMERQKPALDVILASEAEHVLVCMHGRAMKSLICLMLNIPLSRMEEFQHVNLCLYQIEANGTANTLVRQNDISHLAAYPV
jgi:broad specificity phosphatase PhoE